MEITVPGKVLLLGGYAVLEGKPALSIALFDKNGQGVNAKIEDGEPRLVSPQFGIDRKMSGVSITTLQKSNIIAFFAWKTAEAYLASLGIKCNKKVTITNSQIFGNKDEKSGLGSSGASTVAIVAALFESCGLRIKENREKINKVAQIAHSLATMKVGSGFDIATSTYGTISYVRYGKEIIGGIKTGNDNEFEATVKELVEKKWPMMVIEQANFTNYDLLVFNVRGKRTSTVSSVRAIMSLKECLPDFYKDRLHDQAALEEHVMHAIKTGNDSEVRRLFHSIRSLQKLMSDWAVRVGVGAFDHIEPEPLTNTINESEELEGIIAGRCPGSGGYDSIVFLARKEGRNPEIINKIVEIGAKNKLKLEFIETKIDNEGARVIG